MFDIGIAFILILGLGSVLRKLAQHWDLPQLLFYIVCGMLFQKWLKIPHATEIRNFALVIILLRAGLGLDLDNLKDVGRPAMFLSFLPGVLEGFTVAFCATLLFGIPFVEAGMLGFILAAVSPAVVVPAMIWLQEQKIGTNKHIPTMILAGASLDDVVAITIVSVFTGLYVGNGMSIGLQIAMIPVSIGLGVVLGIVSGKVLKFKKWYLVLAVASGLSWLQFPIPVATLLSVMVYGMTLNYSKDTVYKSTQKTLNNLWKYAEMVLFMLVGALIQPQDILVSGFMGLLVIGAGLLMRSLGVWISLWKTPLENKEKIFCIIAYTPKATVQAAMAGVPLSLGVGSGNLIIVIAVLSIFVTTPIAAILIRRCAPILLCKDCV